MDNNLQRTLNAMDEKTELAQNNLKDIQKMVDECQSDINEIKDVLQKLKKIN